MKTIILFLFLVNTMLFPQIKNAAFKYSVMYSARIDTVWEEIVTNGTFDSDLTGWKFYNDITPITFEWVASGGGFTGAVHLKNDFSNSGLQTDVVSVGYYTFQVGEVYKFSCDVTIVSGAETNIRARIYSPIYYVNLAYVGPQTVHIETQFTVSTPSTSAYIWVQQGASTITEWYVDNISLKKRTIKQ